jgi:hypothetical protein
MKSCMIDRYAIMHFSSFHVILNPAHYIPPPKILFLNRRLHHDMIRSNCMHARLTNNHALLSFFFARFNNHSASSYFISLNPSSPLTPIIPLNSFNPFNSFNSVCS